MWLRLRNVDGEKKSIFPFILLENSRPPSPPKRRSVLSVHWKDWCWSWNSNTLATWCEELTHLKRPWCWKRLRAGGEGDYEGWDDWMASLTQWTWVWVNFGSWWWTGRPGVLHSMGSQRVGHNWVTELNWSFPREPQIPFSQTRTPDFLSTCLGIDSSINGVEIIYNIYYIYL